MKAEEKQLARQLIILTIPAVIENTLQSAANYADYIMVGGLGAQASAAIGVTSSVNMMIKGMMTAAGIGIVSYVAVEQGRGDEEKAREASVQVMYLAGIIGTFLLTCTLLISPFLPGWMGADNEIKSMASQYFAITNLGIFGSSFNMLLSSALRGVGNMKVPMYVNVGMNVLNILLNFIFIYDTRNVDILGHSLKIYGADMGVYGAALATAISFTVGGICMVIAVFKSKAMSPRGLKFKVNVQIMKNILIIAIPAFLCRICNSLGRVIFTSFVTGMGTTTFAAHTIALTAESAFFMPVMGAQSAVATLAGNAKGEGDIKKLNSLVRLSNTFICILMLLFAGVMVIASRHIMLLFTSEPEVAQIGTKLFYIVAINEPIFGISVIMEGMFNGIGYTKQTFRITVVVLWIVRVLGTWIMINIFDMGIYGAWICMILDNTARGTALLIYYEIIKRKLGQEISTRRKLISEKMENIA